MNFSLQNCRIDNLSSHYQSPVVIDVLRLDLIHPIVSGNKWFKLKEYLSDAKTKDKKTLLTFGGAYSNHIVATAAAARRHGFNSIGIIRGEKPDALSHTLKMAINYGMKLYFISREEYKLKIVPDEVYNDYRHLEIYMISEGGYGIQGMHGAKDILLENNTSSYTDLICAAGTGTTLAGIVDAALPHQKTIGIPVLKNNFSLQQEIEDLLPKEKHKTFELLHDYHFGGYAKYSKQLLEFMNALYAKTTIPTDFVYTGKIFYAVFDLLKKGYFARDSKILVIHTGGLQGNQSLPKGTLISG